MFTIGISKSFDFASLSEIQSLKQNSFAASLIETISLSLSASKGSDASDVLEMLSGLKNQLLADQGTDDKLFESKNTEFEDHISKLNSEIEELDRQIKALALRIDELTGLITVAELNIQSFNERINNLKQSIDEMSVIFDNDKLYYEQKIEGLGVLEVKMRLVMETLSKMIGSVSGDGKYDHITATETEKRDQELKAANAQVSFLQIKKMLPDQYASLAQLTLMADQKALEKLNSILNIITQDITKEKIDKAAYLENMGKSFEELKNQMLDEIDANTKARNEQTVNKENYESEKGLKEKEKSEKEARRDSLINERDINIELQKQLTNTHATEAADRKKEVEIVNTLIGIVERRLVKSEGK